jgi:hypothetical protein
MTYITPNIIYYMLSFVFTNKIINNLGELVAMHGDLMNGVAMAVQAMQAPKRRILERGPDGKATGVIEITGDTGQ